MSTAVSSGWPARQRFQFCRKQRIPTSVQCGSRVLGHPVETGEPYVD
ncbi:MAG: hypothetical protein ACRD1C_12495 [Terriglobales bacterium]